MYKDNTFNPFAINKDIIFINRKVEILNREESVINKKNPKHQISGSFILNTPKRQILKLR